MAARQKQLLARISVIASKEAGNGVDYCMCTMGYIHNIVL